MYKTYQKITIYVPCAPVMLLSPKAVQFLLGGIAPSRKITFLEGLGYTEFFCHPLVIPSPLFLNKLHLNVKGLIIAERLQILFLRPT